MSVRDRHVKQLGNIRTDVINTTSLMWMRNITSTTTGADFHLDCSLVKGRNNLQHITKITLRNEIQ